MPKRSWQRAGPDLGGVIPQIVVVAAKTQRMDAVVLIACLALVGTLLIVLLLLCRLVQPYDIAWFLSSREDKLKLSKMRLYNANGYLVGIIYSPLERLARNGGTEHTNPSIERIIAQGKMRALRNVIGLCCVGIVD